MESQPPHSRCPSPVLFWLQQHGLRLQPLLHGAAAVQQRPAAARPADAPANKLALSLWPRMQREGLIEKKSAEVKSAKKCELVQAWARNRNIPESMLIPFRFSEQTRMHYSVQKVFAINYHPPNCRFTSYSSPFPFSLNLFELSKSTIQVEVSPAYSPRSPPPLSASSPPSLAPSSSSCTTTSGPSAPAPHCLKWESMIFDLW